jgi:hypothetical protein
MRWRFRAAVESRTNGSSANDEAGQGQCRTCRHFRSDPRLIEALTPGLVSFGSGDASVRADDGLCLHHARYVAANAGCESYEPRTKG